MMRYILGVVLIAFVSNASSRQCQCGVQPTSARIAGGAEAHPAAYPWMAAITTAGGNNVLGGGALINDQYVLTAAHVVTDKYLYERVVVGEHDLKFWKEKDHEILEIETAVIHPQYSGDYRYHNDIALIKLKKPVTFGPKVQPICLPDNMEIDTKTLFAAGWGNTGLNTTGSVVLRDVNLKERNCSEWRTTETGPNQICAGDEGKDTCPGDSGVSLMTRRSGQVYSVGVLSYGAEPCGTLIFPGVFTRVSRYMPWIKSVVGQNFCSGV